jgi:uncharacterized protein (TIGR02145 family)
MKKFYLTLTCLTFTAVLNAQNIGINSTGVPPHSSAGLDINFTDRGLLIPRMTTAQRNAIASPSLSLLIFNTDNNCFQTYNSISGAWENLYCFTGCTTTPSAPFANNATGISTNSFVANWSFVVGATGYYLDVATNAGFTSFVPGYNNLNVGNVTTYNVNSLTCGTTYYYRIRAYNACGTSNNSNMNSVTLACTPGVCGTQVWMAANLNVGTMISASTNQANNGVQEKWCYNNTSANCTAYGGLYQWGEAMQYAASVNCDPCGSSGVQGLCPPGFHIPTDLEWSRYEWCVENTISPTGTTPLTTFQTNNGWRGSNTTAGPGAKMKATSPAWNGTNTSGFSALPGGYAPFGYFYDLNTYAWFWSATEADFSLAMLRYLFTGNSQSYRISGNKSLGLSVRCLQN